MLAPKAFQFSESPKGFWEAQLARFNNRYNYDEDLLNSLNFEELDFLVEQDNYFKANFFDNRGLKAGVVFQPYTSKEYRVVSRAAEVNEGQTAVFDVSTVNVAAGTQLAYTITGVSAADVAGGQLSGTINVGSNGKATLSIAIAADNLTEGPEVLTVAIRSPQGGMLISSNIMVNDTSMTIVGIPGDDGGGGGGGGKGG